MGSFPAQHRPGGLERSFQFVWDGDPGQSQAEEDEGDGGGDADAPVHGGVGGSVRVQGLHVVGDLFENLLELTRRKRHMDR